METIKSKDNNKIKYIRSIKNKKTRDKEKVFLVEGIKFVTEAIKDYPYVKFVLLSEKLRYKSTKDLEILHTYILNKNIEVFYCEDNIFENIGDTITSQGAIAVLSQINYTFDEILRKNFIIFCDRVQDPGNLGTIIRTADAFSPSAVVLNRGCTDVYNSKVVRATAGCIFRTLFLYEENKQIINKLKNEGFKIISTVVKSSFTFEDVENAEKLCIVIGNEG